MDYFNELVDGKKKLTEDELKKKAYIDSMIQAMQQYYVSYDMSDNLKTKIATDDEAYRALTENYMFFTKLGQNPPVMETSDKNPFVRPKTADEQKAKLTTFDIMKSEIAKSMNELHKTKSIFSRDSDEFKKYYADLKKLNDALQKPYDEMHPFDTNDIQKLVSNLKESSIKYQTVREEKNKAKHNDRGEARVNVTKNLQTILDQMNKPGAVYFAVNEHCRQRDIVKGIEKKDSSFDEINERAKAGAKDTQKALKEAKQSFADRNATVKNDDARYQKKEFLRNLAAEYKDKAAGDKDLEAILNDIDKYTKMDATAVSGQNTESNTIRMDTVETYNAVKVQEEIELYDKITKSVEDYYDKLQEKMQNSKYSLESDDEKLLMAGNMAAFFEGEKLGNLEVEENYPHIDAHGKNFINVVRGSGDYRDIPLFPHDPSPNDISQGQLGDCYLVSSLSAIAMQNPRAIKDAMRDNGDGTVTVRFFQRKPAEGMEAGHDDVFTPVYVTVDKIAPKTSGALNSLWVQMFERAYAASGMFISEGYTDKMTVYVEPVPDNIDELYEKYSKLPENERPTKDECPWLYAEDGTFRKWQPAYAHISGGNSGLFVESVMGDKYRHEVQIMQKMNTVSECVLEGIRKFAESMMDSNSEGMSYIKNDATSRVDFVYASYNDGKPIPCDKDGKPIESKEYKLACDIASLISLTEKFVKSYDKPADQLYNTWIGLTEHIQNNPEYGKGNSIVEAMRDIINKGDSDLVSKAENIISDIDLVAQKNTLQNGEIYTDAQKDLYKKIADELNNKNIVTTQTIQAVGGDKRKIDGINLNHAYNVVGLEKKTLDNGKELLFVKVRNPHGIQHTRDYNVNTKTGEFKAFETNGKKEGAESLIELNEFYRDFSAVSYNKSDYSGLHSVKIANEQVSKAVVGDYKKAMDQFIKELEDIPEDTPEYQKLVKDAKATKTNIVQSYGRDVSALDNSFKALRNSMQNYLEKSSLHKDICKSMKLIADKCMNPKNLRESLKKDVAEAALNSAFEKYKSGNDEKSKALAENLQTNQFDKCRDILLKDENFNALLSRLDTVNLGRYATEKESVTQMAEFFEKSVMRDLQSKTIEKQASVQNAGIQI